MWVGNFLNSIIFPAEIWVGHLCCICQDASEHISALSCQGQAITKHQRITNELHRLQHDIICSSSTGNHSQSPNLSVISIEFHLTNIIYSSEVEYPPQWAVFIHFVALYCVSYLFMSIYSSFMCTDSIPYMHRSWSWVQIGMGAHTNPFTKDFLNTSRTMFLLENWMKYCQSHENHRNWVISTHFAIIYLYL